MVTQQTQARNQTEAQVRALTREILSVYDDARKQINRELRDLYTKILSGVKPEDYYNTAIKFNRLKTFQKEVDSLYIKQSIKAGTMTAESSRLAINNAYYKNEFTLTWFTPNIDVQLNFTPIPPELVNLAVTGNIEKWRELDAALRQRIERTFGSVDAYVPKEGTLSSFLVNNRRDEVLKINRAISSGLLQGKPFTETARGVAQVIGTVTPGKSTGAKASALRIVRTESNRTYNAGAYANTQSVASQGVNIKRTILSTLDTSTREQSIEVDGQSVDPGDPFIYPGGVEVLYPGNSGNPAWDINDRETVIDTVEGIPPQVRRGRNPVTGENEVFEWKTYPEWARDNGLTQKPSGRWS